MSSMISLLIFSPSIGAIYEDRGGGISMGSTFLQTFIAISSGMIKINGIRSVPKIKMKKQLNKKFKYLYLYLVLVLVGDSRVSAISQSPSKSSQPISANINNPALFYSSSTSSPMSNIHRKRRNSYGQKEGMHF